MVIPYGFGVPPENSIEISLRSKEEASGLSQRIHEFCMGIRLVFSCASEIKYQSILGLNALTIWLRN